MILIKCLRPLIAPLRSAANHIHTATGRSSKDTEKQMHVQTDAEIHRDRDRDRGRNIWEGNQSRAERSVHNTQFSEFVTFHLLLLYYLLSFWAVTVVAVAVMAMDGVKGFAIKSCIV